LRSRHQRFRTAALTALLLGISALTFVAAPSKTAQAAPNCKDVFFAGARGSGEKANAWEGFGETVGRMLIKFRSKVPKYVSVKADPVFYEAVDIITWENALRLGGVYRDSVDDGTTYLHDTLKIYSERCPRTVYVLAGYSQGAQVVTNVLEELHFHDPQEIADKIVSVALFASPEFAPKDKKRILAYPTSGDDAFAMDRQGVYRDMVERSEVDTASYLWPYGNVVNSFCVKNDPVCQWKNLLHLGRHIERHFVYADEYSGLAGRWAAREN
jgi:hypothetical protein